jgi:flagellar protein FliS
MLFDGAVNKLNLAKKSIQAKDIDASHQELTKVQRIFTELMVALDMEKGGDLAVELFRIYDFIYHHLVQANIKQDVKFVDEVYPIVENLRDAWREAVMMYENGESGKVEFPRSPELPKQENPIPAAAPAKPTIVKPVPYPAKTTSAKSTTPPENRPRLNIRG